MRRHRDFRPKTRWGNVAIAALVISIVGLAAGALAAFLRQNIQNAAVPSQVAVAPAVPARTAKPRPVVNLAPTSMPPTAAASIAPVATAVPQPVATRRAPVAPLPVVTTVATVARGDSRSAAGIVAGRIRIDETATSVGTIVWSGSARPVGTGALAVDVRKVLVAGRRVGACEQATHLRVVVTGASQVPYQEIGCNGSVASGEMQIVSSTGDGRSFRGAFYSGGSKLGDFTIALGSRK